MAISRQERLKAAQALLALVKQGKAGTVIEDYKRNTTGNSRAGDAYQTVLTDGGNVLHRYTNGDVVFVRKQPRERSYPPGTDFVSSTDNTVSMRPRQHGQPPIVTTVSDQYGNEDTSIAPAPVPGPHPLTEAHQSLQTLLGARRRRRRPPVITEISG